MNDLQLSILNGLQGDPAVYGLLRISGEGILFDLGPLEAMTQKDLLRVRHAFVTHTHMDHFMGFDRWLRANIPHKRLVKVWGPAPFFERVQAKLKAYAWNLIAPDQLRFEVHEVQPDGRVKVATLRNSTDFAIEGHEAEESWDRLTTFQDGSSMSCVQLDHNGLPSLGYKLRFPEKQRFLHDRLDEFGLTSGPWISQLQYKVRNGDVDGLLTAQGRTFKTRELADRLLQKEDGSAFVYLTDFSFDRENVGRLQATFRKADRIICESSFLDEDRSRAASKAHLTTRQSALIAAALGVHRYDIFHVSGIYGQGAEASVNEARRFFAEYSGLDAVSLASALEAEFLEVEALRALT